MRSLLTLALFLCALAASGAERRSTRVGDFHDFPHFPSTGLGNTRTLSVLLPPSYAGDPGRRYPVLYALDNQNLFDEATSFIGKEWQLDETLKRMWSDDELPEIIVVGVDHAGAKRQEEFSPGPGGDKFVRFLTSEVKPFIDNRFRTKRDAASTAVMGSSLGGIISLWATLTRPDVFGQSAALSPSYQLREPVLELLRKGPRKHVRLYMDLGTEELQTPEDNARFQGHQTEVVEALRGAGYREGKDFVARLIPGGHHSEPDWAARVDVPLKFLFAPEGRTP